MPTPDERIVAKNKIRKLLFTAKDKSATENERATARKIAERMMQKFDISEGEVWATTTIDDIPEDVQDDMMGDIMSYADDFISALEKEQEKAFEKVTGKLYEEAEKNKGKIKKGFSDFIDGLFKK